MSERMKRIHFSIPEQLRHAFIELTRLDGRKPGEIIRSLIAQFIREMAQSKRPR